MLNRIIVIGRLTKDPELRSTSNGVAVGTFNVACERNFAGNDGKKEVDFIPIVVWRGLAETCDKYLAKGKLVAVEGRLQIRDYENDKGVKRRIAEIVADNVQFLSPKHNTPDGSSSYTPSAGEFDEVVPIDDIPF